VTGGAGFIGSHLVDALIEREHEVIVVDNLSTGKKENLNPNAQFYQVDVQSSRIKGIIKEEQPEAIFHCAAQISVRKSVEDPIEDAKTNILGSLNLIEEFCKSSGASPGKFIFASTGGAIYGDADEIPTPESYNAAPVSPYGIAKLAIEKYLNYHNKEYGMPYTVLRFGNVYGPRQDSQGEAGVIAIFTDQMLSNKQPVINGDGTQTRDYIFIEDVVDANLKALNKNKNGIFNVGTGKETSVNELFKQLKQLTGYQGEEKHGPAKEGEQQRSCLDINKIKKELGWEPNTNLDLGLRKTVEWFRKNS